MQIIRRAVWQMTPQGYELLEVDRYDYNRFSGASKGRLRTRARSHCADRRSESADQYNVVGPGGATKWTQGNPVVTGYDQSGHPIYNTQSTQTTTLAPDQQKQYDLQNQIADQLLSSANKNIPTFANTPYSGGTNFDYNTAPRMRPKPPPAAGRTIASRSSPMRTKRSIRSWPIRAFRLVQMHMRMRNVSMKMTRTSHSPRPLRARKARCEYGFSAAPGQYSAGPADP